MTTLPRFSIQRLPPPLIDMIIDYVGPFNNGWANTARISKRWRLRVATAPLRITFWKPSASLSSRFVILFIEHCPHLDTLFLCDVFDGQGDELARVLAACSKLQRLVFVGVSLNSRHVAAITRFAGPLLSSVAFHGCLHSESLLLLQRNNNNNNNNNIQNNQINIQHNNIQNNNIQQQNNQNNSVLENGIVQLLRERPDLKVELVWSFPFLRAEIITGLGEPTQQDATNRQAASSSSSSLSSLLDILKRFSNLPLPFLSPLRPIYSPHDIFAVAPSPTNTTDQFTAEDLISAIKHMLDYRNGGNVDPKCDQLAALSGLTLIELFSELDSPDTLEALSYIIDHTRRPLGYLYQKAIRHSELRNVFDLLLQKVSPNQVVGDIPPLLVACEGGKVDHFRALMQAGADPNLKFWGETSTALHMACKKRNLAWIRMLVQEFSFDVNKQNSLGRTPLHCLLCSSVEATLAQRRDLISAATLLIEHGANIHAFDCNGECALHFAVANPGAIAFDLVQLLLKKGAASDIEKQNQLGCTPCSVAIRFSPHVIPLFAHAQPQIIRSLFSFSGMSWSTTQFQVSTIVHCVCGASGFVDLAVLKELLKIDPSCLSILDTQCATPLHVACAFTPANRELIDFLLTHIADIGINTQNMYGETALHKAVQNNNSEAVSALLSVPGIDVSICDHAGHTALEDANLHHHHHHPRAGAEILQALSTNCAAKPRKEPVSMDDESGDVMMMTTTTSPSSPSPPKRAKKR